MKDNIRIEGGYSMSGIWGMVDLKGGTINDIVPKQMKEPYRSCKIDEYFQIKGKNIYFECGMQYFTKEAEFEKLPFADKARRRYYNADIYLDNREELLERLQIPKKERKSMADGTLFRLAYEKWNKECVSYIRGSYTAVIYDEDKQEILCIRDATGNRCLYYCIEDGIFYFSTLIKAITNARHKRTQLNKRWLSDFLALDQLAMTTECTETPYEGIYKLEPAQIITFSLRRDIEKEEYWRPLERQKELRLNTDRDYQKQFAALFQDAVNCTLRTDGRIGILLSGGLDSTATASLAAGKLKADGKKLYSYTSVPEKEYKSDRMAYSIVNESPNVKILESYLGNLQCNFCDMEGQNCWDDKEEMLDIYEMPYKAVQNVSWINGAVKMAREQGCQIMLNGQFGNSTISFGYEDVHYQTLLKQGKMLTLKKEIDMLHQRIPIISRKKVWHDVLKEVIPYKIRAVFSKEKDMFVNVLLCSDKIKEFDIERRFKKKGLNSIIKRQFTWKQFRRFIVMKEAMSQIGEMETKVSLKHGVMIKDPSRDKRLIEFCLSLPSEQFVREGISRRLIRVYMKEYMPEELLTDLYRKGQQSADWMYRLEKKWPAVYQEMKQLFDKGKGKEYFEQDKVQALLERCRERATENETEMRTLFYSAILAEFVEREG